MSWSILIMLHIQVPWILTMLHVQAFWFFLIFYLTKNPGFFWCFLTNHECGWFILSWGFSGIIVTPDYQLFGPRLDYSGLQFVIRKLWVSVVMLLGRSFYPLNCSKEQNNNEQRKVVAALNTAHSSCLFEVIIGAWTSLSNPSNQVKAIPGFTMQGEQSWPLLILKKKLMLVFVWSLAISPWFFNRWGKVASFSLVIRMLILYSYLFSGLHWNHLKWFWTSLNSLGILQPPRSELHQSWLGRWK